MTHWNLTLDLSGFWHRDDLSFEEKRDGIVAAIKASRWRRITPYPDYFDSLVDEVAETPNITEFDLAFGELYDQADVDRVWIETR